MKTFPGKDPRRGGERPKAKTTFQPMKRAAPTRGDSKDDRAINHNSES